MIGSVVASVYTFIILPILIAGGTITIFGNNFGVSGSVFSVASVTNYSDTFLILPI